MVISKEQARQIAEKLCERKLSAFNNAKANLEKVVTAIRKKQIPLSVMKAFKEHPKWARTGSYISFSGHGISYQGVTMTESLPHTGNNVLDLTSESADKIKVLIKAKERAKEEYDELKSEISTALLTLRTYKRITESFPEAAKHLAKPVAYLPPAIPIESIMKKLKGK